MYEVSVCLAEVVNVLLLILGLDVTLVNWAPSIPDDLVKLIWVGGPGTGWFAIWAGCGPLEGSQGLDVVMLQAVRDEARPCGGIIQLLRPFGPL